MCIKLEFKFEEAFVYRGTDHQLLAELVFSQAEDDVVVAEGIFTDPSLRGQGIAGKLLDAFVSEMNQQGKKIKPSCPYIVNKFKDNPEKYDFINSEKNKLK